MCQHPGKLSLRVPGRHDVGRISTRLHRQSARLVLADGEERPMRERREEDHATLRVLQLGGQSLGEPLPALHSRQGSSQVSSRSGIRRWNRVHRYQRVRIVPGHLSRRRSLRQHSGLVPVQLPTWPHPGPCRNAMRRFARRGLLRVVQGRSLLSWHVRTLLEGHVLLYVGQSLGSRLRGLSAARN